MASITDEHSRTNDKSNTVMAADEINDIIKEDNFVGIFEEYLNF